MMFAQGGQVAAPPAGDGLPYAKCVIHLRLNNTSSPGTIIDEINGSSAWTAQGGATQSAVGAIAGAGSLDLTNNADGLKYLVSTSLAVRNAMAFDESDDWVIRFKYRANTWDNNRYACVMGSGPGNPVLTFANAGEELVATLNGSLLNNGSQVPAGAHEYMVGQKDGRQYKFVDGGVLVPGGEPYGVPWALQDEWRIGTQSHAPEALDGWLDELQVFRGVGPPVASYLASVGTPFPGP